MSIIFSNASEHFATTAMEAATTASMTDSARPAGAQANSRFAQNKVLKIPPGVSCPHGTPGIHYPDLAGRFRNRNTVSENCP